MMLWSIRQSENLDKAIFPGIGKYDIPRILPMEVEQPVEMIGFNFAAKYKHPERVGIHFFLKDYQFSRLWTSPDMYTGMLKRFRFVCTPDFSMYTDFPLALQINSHYRKHWLGAYWQSKGITVIPTICWSDERSFEWCFDGEPEKSTVAISPVGTQLNERSKSLFLLGYQQMMSRLADALQPIRQCHTPQTAAAPKRMLADARQTVRQCHARQVGAFRERMISNA